MSTASSAEQVALVRRYVRARRNLLARDDLVAAVHGRWAHREIARLGGSIETLFVSDGAATDDVDDHAVAALIRRVATLADRMVRVGQRTVHRMQPDAEQVTLLSLLRIPSPVGGLPTRRRGLVLVADGVTYAGNLGTLLRTADGCGADAVVLAGGCARITNPKVFVASRGTVLTVPVLSYDDSAQALGDLLTAGYRCYVADPAARRPYTDVDFAGGPTAVVVGSERDGVSDAWRRATTGLVPVAIPMRGLVDSFNVATAAAVLLAEAQRQRHG
jgi:TrmH family RNA methyltransferase